METGQQAAKDSAALRAESRVVEYPTKCKSGTAREKYKEETLHENQEVLFTDYAQQREGKKNNLIFFIDSIYIYIIMRMYPARASAQEAD